MTRRSLGRGEKFGANDVRHIGPDVPPEESGNRPYDQPGEPPLRGIPYTSGKAGEQHYSQRLPHGTGVSLHLFVQACFELSSTDQAVHELCHAVLRSDVRAHTTTVRYMSLANFMPYFCPGPGAGAGRIGGAAAKTAAACDRHSAGNIVLDGTEIARTAIQKYCLSLGSVQQTKR